MFRIFTELHNHHHDLTVGEFYLFTSPARNPPACSKPPHPSPPVPDLLLSLWICLFWALCLTGTSHMGPFVSTNGMLARLIHAAAGTVSLPFTPGRGPAVRESAPCLPLTGRRAHACLHLSAVVKAATPLLLESASSQRDGVCSA